MNTLLKNKLDKLYYLNTLIFVVIYVIILTFLSENIPIFDFINKSPDKTFFKDRLNSLRDINLSDLLISGQYILPIQLNLIFNKYIHIVQIILLCSSIICIGQLINIYFKVTKYISLIILLIPSFAYIFILNLKDFYLFIALCNMALILHYSKIVNQNIFHKLNIIKLFILIISIFINCYFFYFTKLYFFYLVFFIYIIFLFFNYFQNKSNNWSQILCLIFYLFIILLYNFIFNSNLLDAPIIYSNGELFPGYSNILNWEYSQYVPLFVENFFKTISEIRFSNIQYNIEIGANTLITENISPNSINQFLINFPYLMFKSLIPFKIEILGKDLVFLYLISVLEQLAIFIMLLVIFLYKEKTSYSYLFITIFIIFSFLYTYVNPNTGSILRYKSIIQIPIIVLGVIYFLKMIKNIFFPNMKELDFYDFLKIFFSLIAVTLLFLIRDIIIINSDVDDVLLKFTVSLLIILSIISNIFISPSISSINSIKNRKIYGYINFLNLITSFFFLFLCAIFFIFCNKFIFNTGISTSVIIYTSFIFYSIPLNVIISSKLLKENKKVFVFSLNLFVPTIFILIFIFFNKSNNYLYEILFLSTCTYSLLMSLLLIPIKFKFIDIQLIFIKGKSIYKKFIYRLFSKVILQIYSLFFLILIFFYNFINLDNIFITYFLIKFIMLFVTLFNLFFAYNLTKTTKDILSVKNFFFINLIVSIILVFVYFIFAPFLHLILKDNLISDKLLNYSSYTFILMPCLIYNLLIFKNILNHNFKYIFIYKYLIVVTIVSIIISLIYDTYIIKIIYLYFIIVIFNYFIVKQFFNISFLIYFLLSLLFLYINFINYKIILNESDYNLIIFNIFILSFIYCINLIMTKKMNIF